MQGLAAVINSKSEYPPPNQCACRLLPTWALMTLTKSDRHCQDKRNRIVRACVYAWMCVLCVSYRQNGWNCFHAMHTPQSCCLTTSAESNVCLCNRQSWFRNRDFTTEWAVKTTFVPWIILNLVLFLGIWMSSHDGNWCFRGVWTIFNIQ